MCLTEESEKRSVEFVCIYEKSAGEESNTWLIKPGITLQEGNLIHGIYTKKKKTFNLESKMFDRC